MSQGAQEAGGCSQTDGGHGASVFLQTVLALVWRPHASLGLKCLWAPVSPASGASPRLQLLLCPRAGGQGVDECFHFGSTCFLDCSRRGGRGKAF